MPSLKILSSKAWRAWRTLPEASPQRWFAVLAVLFGAIFAIITPAYDPPDEYSHLARAWSIGHGHFLASKTGSGSSDTGGMVPTSFKKLGEAVRAPDYSLHKLTELGTIPLNAGDQAWHGHPNLVIYSPLVYAPQAIGLDVGELLHLPAYYTLVLARLCNLIVYVLLFYWAIRLLPFGKWMAVIIGLLPMHILLAGSMSADPLSIGLAALSVAVVLYFRDRRTSISRREFGWILVLVAALSLTKLPFPLLIGLLLFLPIPLLGGTAKKRWLHLGMAAVTAIVIGGGWLLLARKTMVPYGPPGVDAAAQVNFLHNPIGFIKAFFATYATPVSDSFVQNYVIGVGPVVAWLPIWASYLYTTFLIASLAGIRTTSRAVFTRAQKWITSALGVTIFVTISLLLYISWTPVGAPIIEGMQSRYFTPFLILIIPLVAVGVASKGKVREGLLTTSWYRYMPLVYLITSVIAAFHYFYSIKIVVPF
jgi:uncharacterized membrane protein